MGFHSSRFAGMKCPASTRVPPTCGPASVPSIWRSAIQLMSDLCFESDRFAALLETLESMAAGEVDARLPISPRHDALDALASGINVLVGELSSASARAKEAQE